MSKLEASPIKWDLILREIENERCIRLLGPDLVTLSEGYSFQHRLQSCLETTKEVPLRRSYSLSPYTHLPISLYPMAVKPGGRAGFGVSQKGL